MPDQIINKDLIALPAQTLRVVDDSGKVIGRVESLSLQRFIHALGDLTNNYLYGYESITTLANDTWYTLVSWPADNVGSQPIHFQANVEYNLNNNGYLSLHFEVSGTSLAQFTITLVHQTGYSQANVGTNGITFVEARIATLGSAGTWAFQIKTGSYSLLANTPALVNVFWSSVGSIQNRVAGSPVPQIPPSISFTSDASSVGTSLTMELTDNATPTVTSFTFALKSDNAAQTSFK